MSLRNWMVNYTSTFGVHAVNLCLCVRRSVCEDVLVCVYWFTCLNLIHANLSVSATLYVVEVWITHRLLDDTPFGEKSFFVQFGSSVKWNLYNSFYPLKCGADISVRRFHTILQLEWQTFNTKIRIKKYLQPYDFDQPMNACSNGRFQIFFFCDLICCQYIYTLQIFTICFSYKYEQKVIIQEDKPLHCI